jgi:hypothetical protein
MDFPESVKLEAKQKAHLTLAAVLVLAACASIQTQAVRLDESRTLAPICPAGVRVFESEVEIEHRYHKVALLSNSMDDALFHKPAMIQSQKNKAAELGANGIILGVGGEAVAIYIPGDSVRVRTACHA